jgi:glycosyltransferase involved in cell wall biosynthesis
MHRRNETILIIGPFPPPYFGVSLATEVTVNGLRKRGLEILHLDTSDARGVENIGRFDFSNVYLALYHSVKLIEMLIKFKCKLVYLPISQGAWGFLRDSFFIFISKLFGRKIIIHLRGGNFKYFYEDSNLIFRFFIKTTLHLVDLGIVQGQSLIKHLEKFFENEKIKVVPNGLSPIPFINYPAKRENEEIKILFLSNLFKSKGFIDLLEAVPDVLIKHNNVKFIFAGEWGSEESRIEADAIIKKREIRSYVIFLGPVFGEEKYSVFKTSDIFAFPTYYAPEGHPWVILEAMASGLPIITTDQGCIKESILDGVNGFIVNKQSPKEIAEKINLLIVRPELREKMGEEGRKRFLEHFTEDIFLDSLGKIFRQFNWA